MSGAQYAVDARVELPFSADVSCLAAACGASDAVHLSAAGVVGVQGGLCRSCREFVCLRWVDEHPLKEGLVEESLDVFGGAAVGGGAVLAEVEGGGGGFGDGAAGGDLLDLSVGFGESSGDGGVVRS